MSKRVYDTSSLSRKEAQLFGLVAVAQRPLTMDQMKQRTRIDSLGHIIMSLLRKGLLYVDTPYEPLPPAVDENEEADDEEEEDHPF